MRKTRPRRGTRTKDVIGLACVIDRAGYEALKTVGSPFDEVSSSLYAPLGRAEFAETLYEIRFKAKSSPLEQIADLFLWPLVLSACGENNRACETLRDAGRFIESQLPAE